MKKTYIIPELLIVKVNTQHHLMDLSTNGSMSIQSVSADDGVDAFVKENMYKDVSVWNDDWSQ